MRFLPPTRVIPYFKLLLQQLCFCLSNALRLNAGESRLEAADCGALTTDYAASVQLVSPAVLVPGVSIVGQLKSRAGHWATRHGCRLAAPKLPLVLALEESVEAICALTQAYEKQ